VPRDTPVAFRNSHLIIHKNKRGREERNNKRNKAGAPPPIHPEKGASRINNPMRCARKAATVPNLRQGGHEKLKESVKKKLRK